MSIQKNAARLASLFEYSTPEGVNVCQHERCTHKDCTEAARKLVLKAEAWHERREEYDELTPALHIDGLSTDFVYEATHDALLTLSDLDEDANEDAARERLDEQEPPCYTSDLTDWLNQHNAHVYYLGEAISEYGDMDGFQALAMAWTLAFRGVADEVLKIVTADRENV